MHWIDWPGVGWNGECTIYVCHKYKNDPRVEVFFGETLASRLISPCYAAVALSYLV